MTKMIKMSLIAAVAVTGMTSAANAQNLEDAIKGVDVSGYVDYRYENTQETTGTTKDVNEYAVKVNAKSKVNDIVTANLSIGFDEAVTKNDGGASVTGGTSGDVNPSLNVTAANFAFVLGDTVVVAGKQGIPSPFVDRVDTERIGAGVVVSHKVNDSLTVAAAHFMNNNFVTDAKTSEFIAMGKVADVNIAAHYNITDAAETVAERTFIKLNTKIAGLDLTGKYASVSDDKEATGDSSVAQLIAGAKLGEVSLTAAYAHKTQDTGTATHVGIDSNDNDSEVNLKVWQASTALSAFTKGDVMALTVAMPLMTNVTGSLTYASADVADSAVKVTESLAQLTYKMSKNFTLHGRYSVMNTDDGSSDSDTKASRIQVKYTF